MKGLRIFIVMAAMGAPLIVGLLFTYEIIKIDWLSFMENQPSFRPMEDPLPIPEDSVPVQGPAFIPGVPWPNPVPADEVSLTRGQMLFQTYCAVCHGLEGRGDGVMQAYFQVPIPDLTADSVANKDDAALFATITYGSANMPSFRDLTVRERWDIVNFLRQLQGKLDQSQATSQE